jgi:glutamate-1-semialdehyde aminotransferase
MIQEGSFQPDRYNDILTTSIGTAEHLGRVRQFGSAGVKAVYGKGSKGKTSHAECISKAEFKEALEQQREEMTAQFNDLFQRMLRQMSANSVYIPPSMEDVILLTQDNSNTIYLLVFILN